MKLNYLHYTLELKHEFNISYSSRKTTPAVLIKLEQDGICGYGEASLPPYLPENNETVLNFLKKVRLDDIHSMKDLTKLMDKVDLISEGNTAAKAAIDIALHDLFGRILKKTCYELYCIPLNELPYTSFTIGIADEKLLKEKIKETEQFKILKIKLGTERDKDIIRVIRSETDKPLYVDANQAWKDKHHALDMINWLNSQNVLLIEQPMQKDNYIDTAWLKERSPIPLIADEAFQGINDIEKVKGVYHGINIKLMKCGGISRAYSIIKLAKEVGLKIMLGCMTETSCAISAAIQLASLADFVDLDGNQLISNDPFLTQTVNDGRLILPDGFGLGVKSTAQLSFIEL